MAASIMRGMSFSASDIAAMTERHSVRGYLPAPVDDALLAHVLTQARWAPSGANLQPGAFVQVRGGVREALSAELIDAWRKGLQEEEDYAYFPKPMPMTLRKRQVQAAQALYGALGVARDDRLGMTLYGLMLAAHAQGLSTCAVGAMAMFPSVIRRHLGLDEESKVVCGMALGYADLNAPVNQTRTTRSALADYFKVVG